MHPFRKNFMPVGNQAKLTPNLEKLRAHVRKQRQEMNDVQKLWLQTTDKAGIQQATVHLPSMGRQVVLEPLHQHQLPQLDRAVSCCGVGTPQQFDIDTSSPSTAAGYQGECVPVQSPAVPDYDVTDEKEIMMLQPVASTSTKAYQRTLQVSMRKEVELFVTRKNVLTGNNDDTATECQETVPKFNSSMPDTAEVLKQNPVTVSGKLRHFLLAKRRIQHQVVSEFKEQSNLEAPGSSLVSVSTEFDSSENSSSLHLEDPKLKLATKFRHLTAKRKFLKTVLSPPLPRKSRKEGEKLKQQEYTEEGMQIQQNCHSKLRIVSEDHYFKDNESNFVLQKSKNDIEGENISISRRPTHSSSTAPIIDWLSKMSLTENELETRCSSSTGYLEPGISVHSKKNNNHITGSGRYQTPQTKKPKWDSLVSNKIFIGCSNHSDSRKTPSSKKEKATSAPPTINHCSTVDGDHSDNMKDFNRTQSGVPIGISNYRESYSLKKWPPLVQSLAAGSDGSSYMKLITTSQMTLWSNTSNEATSSSSLNSSFSRMDSEVEYSSDCGMLPKNEGDHFQDKQDEAFQTQRISTQCKDAMQRKNDTIISKVERRDTNEEEAQLPLDEFKADFELLEERKVSENHNFLKEKLNTKLFSVVLKHFQEPLKKPAPSSPVNLATIVTSRRQAVTKRPGELKSDELPKLQRAFPTSDQLGQIKTDFSDEEDENTFKNTTYVLERCDDPDTYDITAYEDYEENLQYRKHKLIPSWASNASELELSLFLQQPELMKLTFPGDDHWTGSFPSQLGTSKIFIE